ncbi:MAG: hypothetical protein AB7W59_26255, partial [Acidimicrobiia bacterium]
MVGLSLVAAACGGDDGGDTGGGAETAATVDANVKQGVSEALSGSATTAAGGTTETTEAAAPAPTSMDEWRALWEDQRAAVVEKVKEADGGKSADGTTVTGPGGFTMDLSACPAGWSDTEGLTDTEIKIGHTTALSGTLADYGNIAKAIEAQIKEVNDAGGITDSEGKTRKITFIVKDDG